MLITRERLVEGTDWRLSKSTLLTTSPSTSETGSLSTILSVRNIVPNEGLKRRKDHKSFRLSKEWPITKEQR